MGAQRWIDLKIFKLQPSELMKVSLVLMLAKYFHSCSLQKIESLKGVFAPALMAAFPAALIMLQPDLGTSLMLLFTTMVIFFVVGVQWWKFITVGVGVLVSAPIAWQFLHQYQKNRILTFLNPERDPLGTGYHIMQSKIALGSGGIFGKGFLSGTQSHLNFLPEKHTDFIFTMLGEEFGFVGAFGLLLIYSWIIIVLFWAAKTCRNRFGQLICFGFMLNFFIYYFINIAMVLGLMPTVGVPLPLMSFGGSSLLSLMFGFGLAQNAHIHKDQQLSAKGS
jgi:rod shape determining protein RodA